MSFLPQMKDHREKNVSSRWAPDAKLRGCIRKGLRKRSVRKTRTWAITSPSSFSTLFFFFFFLFTKFDRWAAISPCDGSKPSIHWLSTFISSSGRCLFSSFGWSTGNSQEPNELGIGEKKINGIAGVYKSEFKTAPPTPPPRQHVAHLIQHLDLQMNEPVCFTNAENITRAACKQRSIVERIPSENNSFHSSTQNQMRPWTRK